MPRRHQPATVSRPVRVTPQMRKDRALVVVFFNACRVLRERARDRAAIVTTGEVVS